MAQSGATAVRPAAARVVGIGASAGGITALQSLFQALPAEPNLALVVLQHLPADQPSRLATLLGLWSPLPVRPAADGVRPEPDHVYVPAPHEVLTLEQGVFRTRRCAGGERRPGPDTIDAFLESLAADQGPRAVAVVLSGMGMDGTAGAVRVRQAGGVVLVQDPLTALHDAMPTAVITRGIADEVLPVGQIADRLGACGAATYARPAASRDWIGEVSRTLDQILAVVRTRAGFDLRGYKPSPVLWRIQQRMDARRVPLFDDYLALLHDDPGELESLVRGIPIHVTEFFRDPEAWTMLGDAALGPLLETAAARDGIRAWTPACSTGEEAYSLAMLLAERTAAAATPADFRIFASDASPDILARASRGVFSATATARLSAERRSRFFYAADGALRVKSGLRQKMVFAPQDLLADPPFSGLDLITCRNLLIYLEPDAIERVLCTLHAALRPGGYLLLGRGEAMAARHGGFETVSRPWNLHRKSGPFTAAPAAAARPAPRIRETTAVLDHAHRAVVAQGALPSVLVDERLRILRVHGDTGRILRLPEGEPTHDLPSLLPPGWRADLRRAARDALADGQAISVALLDDRAMTLRLTPLDRNGADDARLLISFVGEPEAPADGADLAAPLPMATRTAEDWSEAVRLSHAELEASREELQALNEELKAANAQLADTNDDLNDANAQLRDKVDELAMQGRVLSAGAVMTLCLDAALRVRWFTPALEALLPLRPADAGRAITDFAPRVTDPRFLADVRAVMEDDAPRDAEVRDPNGRWYMRRIRPHRPDGDAPGGVVVSFTEITARRRAEAALRRSEASLLGQNAAFEAALNGAPLSSALDLLVRTAIAQTGEDVRCAFYLADPDGATLRHVVGMPDDYARSIEAIAVGPDSGACGRAAQTARPVICADVAHDPRWADRLPLAARHEVGACWCFPVETTAAKVVGVFAIYHRAPRAPTPREMDLAVALTRAAAIIISRHQEIGERARAEAALQNSRRQIARELDDARRLQAVSSLLIEHDDPAVIYGTILDAAMAIMRSGFGSIQALDAGRGTLRLLAWRNFHPRSAALWQTVPVGTGPMGGAALRHGGRIVVPDIGTDPAVRRGGGLEPFRLSGIVAVQSTPLTTRDGRLLGMISTHWGEVHTPDERSLRLLDVLARQVADMVERSRGRHALQGGEARLSALLSDIG